MRARLFDRVEAFALRQEGLSYGQIGLRLGVTGQAIRLALDERARIQQQATSAEWQRRTRRWVGTCIDCGAPATAIQGYSIRRGRCRPCSYLAQATSVRPDTLSCHGCGEWKPDDAFTRKPSRPTRRHRDAECKACQAARKRELRATKRASA